MNDSTITLEDLKQFLKNKGHDPEQILNVEFSALGNKTAYQHIAESDEYGINDVYGLFSRMLD